MSFVIRYVRTQSGNSPGTMTVQTEAEVDVYLRRLKGLGYAITGVTPRPGPPSADAPAAGDPVKKP